MRESRAGKVVGVIRQVVFWCDAGTHDFHSSLDTMFRILAVGLNVYAVVAALTATMIYLVG